jgi:hypothetical protein
MLIAEARVETRRSSRYLVQLCRHISELTQARPDMQARVEWAEDQGMIDFGWGQCSLHAGPGLLTIHAEARDEESLRRLQQRVADRLELFGRRDGVTVTWTGPCGKAEPLSSQASRHYGEGGEAHG